MRQITLKGKQVIFKKGDKADCMYLIVTGKVKIYANFGDKAETELAAFTAGKYFGEMGVIENEPRSATAVADSQVRLIEIRGEDLPKFIADNASDTVSIMENLSMRLRITTKAYSNACRSITKYIDSDEKPKAESYKKLSGIVETYKRMFGVRSSKPTQVKTEYEEGEIIFSQGEKGSNMFRVQSGEVAFFLNYGKKNQIELKHSVKGDIFGEMAVIEIEKRSATAVACKKTKLYTVTSTEFLSFVENNPADALKILRNLSARLRKTTSDYVEVLETINEFVEEEKKYTSGGAWDSLNEYSAMYHTYLTLDSYILFK